MPEKKGLADGIVPVPPAKTKVKKNGVSITTYNLPPKAIELDSVPWHLRDDKIEPRHDYTARRSAYSTPI